MPGRDPSSYPPAVPCPQLMAGRFAVLASGLGLGIAFRAIVETRPSTPDALDAYVFGLFVGFALAVSRRHPYRVAGVIPYAALGWTIACGIAVGLGWRAGWSDGVFGGLTLVAGLRFVAAFRIPPFGWVEVLSLSWGIGLVLNWPAELAPSDAAVVLLVLTGVTALVSWALLPRPVIEASLEFLLAPRYKIRGGGPGVAAFPRRGPVLVVSNHAAYLDPLFLAKDIPRPITAMMTALFYDKPIIRQLMVYFYDTIRVREVAVRKDAPELREAVEALDAGKCVVIFPEGFLRRSEEVPLRRFGRGVWHILKDRPETPVVACWIEGGWGSYFSFKDGPPTKNKPKEYRRLITIGYSAPIAVPPDVLADHLATRLYLMNRVNEARAHLGLDLLPEATLPQRGDGEGTDGTEGIG